MSRRFIPFIRGFSYILVIVWMAPLIAIQSQPKAKPIWAEEFDYEGLPDPAKWSYDVGDGCPRLCGWGNNELQYYTTETSRNARVEKGKLIIEAHREFYQGRDYTSARLITRNKGDWQYGRIDIRAKLPYGRGTWPTIWMLPTMDSKDFSWPLDGEIDIMEHVGYNQDMVYGTIHTQAYNSMIGTQKVDSIHVQDAYQAFHVYSIHWTPNKIEWFVDNEKYHTIVKDGKEKEKWPFDRPFYLIMNLAVGGRWGGKHGVDEKVWPQRLEVDYVRVYKH